MSNRKIAELRILPPFAICRMGSSEQPMDNYNVEPNDAEGFRTLTPATTFIVDEDDGSISGSFVPDQVRFKDNHDPPRIKPVSPFLELWARFENDDVLRPLTLPGLKDAGLTPADVVWSIRVANRKMSRRTGDPNDTIRGSIKKLKKHSRRPLIGKSPNFRKKAEIPLGSVQYIRPTKEFPGIRLRVTPPQGLVYGARADDVVPPERAIYSEKRGTWPQHNDDETPRTPELPMARISTVPGEIYALDPSTGRNRGFFDDTWDGIVSVAIKDADGDRLTADARVSVGPPDFAPDSFPVRTLADDLEQIVHGPEVDDVTPEQVIDIIRRALETMQLIDTKFMNDDRYGNRFPNGALWTQVRDRHMQLLTDAQGLNAAEKTEERGKAIRAIATVSAALREYDRVWDDNPPSLLMPALMRGSDGANIALTRRQKRIMEVAYEKYRDTGPDPGTGKRPVSFALHVLPCFREEDIEAMRNLGPSKRIDLTSYTEVREKSDRILNRLRGIGGALMPPTANEGPWPDEWIRVFERWINEGHKP